MATSEIVLQLLTGGILGLVGQMLRFLVGYKKLFDAASRAGVRASDMFQTSRFVVSLMIGFVAGILGVIALSEFNESIFISKVKETIMILIGTGYAGTDFIEGFIKKYIPENSSIRRADQHSNLEPPPPGPSEQPQLS